MVYDDLRKLQDIPHAYEQWHEYRKQLTDYILSDVKFGESILIMGAGRCNDIDVNALLEATDNVTIADRDYSILPDYNGCIKKSVDLIGISDDMFREFIFNLQMFIKSNKDNKTRFQEFFTEKMFALLKKAVPTVFDEKKYDHVVCCGVHSQLINMFAWIWKAFAVNLRIVDDHYVFEAISDYNTIYTSKVNKKLISFCNKRLVIGLEKENTFRPGLIEGAYQAYNNLQELCNKGMLTLDNQISALWPFDMKNNVAYNMNIYSFLLSK